MEISKKMIDEVVETLAKEGLNLKAEERKVEKLNGESYKGVLFMPAGENVGITVNTEGINSASELADIVRRAFSERPAVDLDELCDYERMKKTLVTEVVNAETNKEMLANVPHYMIEDMAVVCRFVLKSDANGKASILVTNQILEDMKVSKEQLFEDAKVYAPVNAPLKIISLCDFMLRTIKDEQIKAIVARDLIARPELNDIRIATVSDGIHGACVLSYGEFFETASELVEGNFFVIPSSIHEIIFCPEGMDEMGANELLKMVTNVNANCVSPNEKLADSVYRYNYYENTFSKVA